MMFTGSQHKSRCEASEYSRRRGSTHERATEKGANTARMPWAHREIHVFSEISRRVAADTRSTLGSIGEVAAIGSNASPFDTPAIEPNRNNIVDLERILSTLPIDDPEKGPDPGSRDLVADQAAGLEVRALKGSRIANQGLGALREKDFRVKVVATGVPTRSGPVGPPVARRIRIFPAHAPRKFCPEHARLLTAWRGSRPDTAE